MVKVVVIDSGPLWLLTQTQPDPTATACRDWVADLLAAGHKVVLPEIVDYEVRRELLRRGATTRLAALDALAVQLRYLKLQTAMMVRAAELWAFARQTGQPTAGSNTIDADVILIAQAESFNDPDAILATANIRHLARFFPADRWANVTP